MATDSLLLCEARAAHARGWVLTPLQGKVPRLRAWTELAPPPLGEVEHWAATGNLGVRTGPVSGVVAIDDDTEGRTAAQDLNLPRTVTAITGNGGFHYYFRCPKGGMRNSVGLLAPSVDVRGDGGQVLLPGSIHPETGERYRWAEGLSPDDIEIVEFPSHLLEKLQARRRARTEAEPGTAAKNSHRAMSYARGALRRSIEQMRSATLGTRNESLNRCAFALGRFIGGGFLAEVEVEVALIEAALSTGLNEGEARKTLRSGIKAGIDNPFHPSEIEGNGGEGNGEPGQAGRCPTTGTLPCTDYGNAERLASQCGEDFRFCHPWAKWLVWTGRHWKLDDTSACIRAAKKVVRSIREEASRCADAEMRETLWEFARKSEKAERIAAMVKLANSEPAIPILPEQLDRHPMLFNCRNGVVDLETGTLRKHERSLHLTMLAPVSYEPAARCTTWEAFLERVLPDEEVRRFLQKAIGYTLTASVAEQVLFFLYGSGANGKSVFLSTLQASGITSNAASRDRVKPGQLRRVRDGVLIYWTVSVVCKEVLEWVRQLLGPHLRTWAWCRRRSSMAVTAALSPSSRPQSSIGRFEVSRVLARS
jgi:putative DNA primase/helicase